MASRKDAYAQSDSMATQASTLDSLSKKLTDDLRTHIKTLGSFELLGKQWYSMVDSLKHISGIALMEQRMPKKAGQDEMTLWDKEDMAVRMVLEEGKLNMCLRTLQEYKTLVRPANSFMGRAKAAAAGLGTTDVELMNKMCIFEESLGMILHCALKSVEAVQTLDLPFTCAHCSEVLHAASAPDFSMPGSASANINRSQEAMVMQYLASIGARSEDIDEDRFASLIEETKMLPALITVVHRDVKKFNKDFGTGAALFLNAVCDMEHFQKHIDGFLATDDEKKAFVALKEVLVQPLLTDGVLERKQVRSLTDRMMKMGRSLS